VVDVRVSGGLTFGGEFCDPEREAQYCAERLPEYRRYLRWVFGCAFVINVLFYLNDGQLFGQPHFLISLAARTVIVATSLVCFRVARQISDFAMLERVCAAWIVPVIFACAPLMMPHTESALFVTFILPNIFFLSLPMSFRRVVASGVTGSYLVLAAYILSGPLSESSFGLVLGMLTVDAVLILLLRHSNRLRRLEWAATRALRAANAELERLVMTDPLTGLANRTRFFAGAAVEIKRAERQNAPLAVVLIDIDFFKQVNDNHGHEAGDQVLAAFAGLCRTVVREQDVAARLGGEEFGLLLPGTDRDQARALADRLRVEVEAQPLEVIPVPITISLGISEVLPEENTVDAALSRADKALYAAKRTGRNKVVLFDRTCVAPLSAGQVSRATAG
jgi:diguanylate cyclase (GGDEF)-like protein